MLSFVQIGAGKIGRSFTAQVFGRAGYQLVFVDLDRKMIDALNKTGDYEVAFIGEETRRFRIKHVRGVHAGELKKVYEEIAEADMLCVSVGKTAVPHIIGSLAGGLLERWKRHGELPLDIILAENMKNGASFVREKLRSVLPPDYPIEKLVGLVETSIGKMVPRRTKDQGDTSLSYVEAEPYNDLIVDEEAFLNPIPVIEGLSPKKPISAWVDRKQYIHNLGHAATAYIGHFSHPRANYLYEVLAEREVEEEVRKVMKQAADILCRIHPRVFTSQHIEAHIEDLLIRFRNRALADTLYRVGCDLSRKLSPDDRMVHPILTGLELGMPVDRILNTLVCSVWFRAKDEKGDFFAGDVAFFKRYGHDIRRIMTEVCSFDDKVHAQLIDQAAAMNTIMEQKSQE